MQLKLYRQRGIDGGVEHLKKTRDGGIEKGEASRFVTILASIYLVTTT
jgi:hypothetical protein